MSSKEREYGLMRIDRSLARLEADPNERLLAARDIENQVEEAFKVKEFLDDLNEWILGSKGRYSTYKYADIKLIEETREEKGEDSGNEEEEDKLRFKRLFDLRYEPIEVQGGQSIRVENRWKEAGYITDSRVATFGFSVFRTISIENKTLSFNIGSKVGLKITGPLAKAIKISTVREGRSVMFRLDDLPPAEEMSKQLMANLRDILENFEEQGYIRIPEEDFRASEEESDDKKAS